LATLSSNKIYVFLLLRFVAKHTLLLKSPG